MHKLALAAVVTASIGGAGALIVTSARSDAHAQPPAHASTTTIAHGAHDNPVECALHAASHAIAAKPSSANAPHTPSLLGFVAASAGADQASNDCAAVGRHIAELEADATHGPDNRPDEATCETCAKHYKKQCENGNWSDERRNCTLAAGDLINAHLCAGTRPAATETPTNIPASLSCAVISQHIATTAQAAGFHDDITDLPQQIQSACDMGTWSIELRSCFAAAETIDALQACIGHPTDESAPHM